MVDKTDYYKRLLMPLKGKPSNDIDVYGFDVETHHKKHVFTRKSGKKVEALKNEFYMGSVVGRNMKRVFYDKKEMADFLVSRTMRDSLLFATNLEFDFNVLFSDRLAEFGKPIYRNRLIGITKKHIESRKVRRWTFLDTLNYIRCSLKDLGRIVGMEKYEKPPFLGSIPKDHEEKRILEDYNINDSAITWKFAEMFREFCTRHNMRMKWTIGSTGLDFWRRNHQKHGILREKDNICEKHFEGSFRGGMTLVMKRGHYPNKLWYYDYNSSYPSCMRDGIDGQGAYPDPSSSVHIEKPNTENIERLDGICKASIKAPYMYFPLLGYKDETSKLLFPYGDFEGWFTNYELRMAMKNGYEIYPEEMIAYENYFVPFRDAVKYLYEIRKRYKEDNHPFQAMVKALMNSGLFGKFGTNFLNMEDLVSLDKISFDDKGRAYHDGQLIEGFIMSDMDDFFNGFISMRKKEKPFKYSLPILASYTTMLGRMKLWEDVKPHESKLIYMDTDSAVFTSNVMKSSDELGDWNLEYEIDEAVFVKPKFYMFVVGGKTYIRMKGVSRTITDYNAFFDVLRKKEVSMQRFTKMKESNRIGISSGTVISITKMLDLEDNKRLWNAGFSMSDWQDSEPLRMIEGMAEKMYEERKRKAQEAYEREQEKMFEKDSPLYEERFGDMFDSKGDDISKEEFFERETDYKHDY